MKEDSYDNVDALLGAFQQFTRLSWQKTAMSGLKPSEIRVLITIRMGKKEPAEQADRLGSQCTSPVTPPTITQMVNRLLSQGLVVRTDKSNQLIGLLNEVHAYFRAAERADGLQLIWCSLTPSRPSAPLCRSPWEDNGTFTVDSAAPTISPQINGTFTVIPAASPAFRQINGTFTVIPAAPPAFRQINGTFTVISAAPHPAPPLSKHIIYFSQPASLITPR